MRGLLERSKMVRIASTAAAAQTDVESSVIDMAGYHAVEFVVAFGVIDATATPRITVHDADTAIVGTAIAATQKIITPNDDEDLVILDLIRPKKRYLSVVVERDVVAADSEVDGIFAILYQARDEVTTQDATVVASGTFVGAGN